MSATDGMAPVGSTHGRKQGWWVGMSWWPLLFAPAAVGLTLLAHAQDWEPLLSKSNHEIIAPPLLAVTTLLLLRTWRARRETLMAALTVLAAAFTCREIHFAGTNALVYLTILVVGIWTWRAWPAMRATLVDWPTRGWLVASFTCYFLSQVVARRVFRGIDGEMAVHVPLEELLETAAHLLYLVAAWRSGDRASEALEA